MAKAKPPEKPAPARKVVALPKPAAKVASAKAAPKVALPKAPEGRVSQEGPAADPGGVRGPPARSRGQALRELRGFLTKRGAIEDFFYYGPRTGWACRYLMQQQSLCSILLSSGHLIGIVALDTGAQARVAWDELSDVGKRARKVAHGTPSLLWLDVPLDGHGAADFKALIKAKLATS